MTQDRFRVAGLLLLAVGAFAAAGPAAAQQAGGVTARGHTRIDVNAGEVNTIAAGAGNTAETNIGAVDPKLPGSKSVTVDVKNVENVVTGIGKKSCVNIGSNKLCQ